MCIRDRSNGFQLAQSLIQMEKHPLVVFVTKRHEYAVQGDVYKRQIRRCMTLFTAIKKWLHRMFGKTEEKTVPRR